MDKLTIYKTLLEKNGPTNQLRILQEECAELAAAINHYLRGKITARLLLTEIADVEVCIDQARYVFGDDAIDHEKQRKLTRLKHLVESNLSVAYNDYSDRRKKVEI